MKWKPSILIGTLVACGWILLILVANVGLLWRVVAGPLNGLTFVCAFVALLSLPAIVVIAYRLYNVARLSYEFDRNRLVITTAASKQIIPMSNIERVIDGGESRLKAKMRSITWPGYLFGTGRVEGIGETLFYAVTPLHQQAIVVTPTVAYGISVPDMDSFVRRFETCQQMGPSLRIQQESQRAAFVHWPIWSDYYTHGVLLGGIALNAALFGILLFRYPSLPHVLPMHYDISGQVDRIAPRNEVFILPMIALVTWATNGIIGALFYRRERVISHLAWSGALVVQGLFLLALWNIIM